MERIVRGAQPDEMDKVLDFCGELFGASRTYFEARFRTCPPANPADSRVAMVGDRIASHIRIYRRELRLRGTSVPGGCLSEVMSHPDFRRQGHGGAVIRDCMHYIRSLGYPIALVSSGVNEFYCSADMVRFPQIATTLAIPQWRVALPPDVRVRRYERGGADDKAVAEIYEEYNRRRNLSVVRDAEYWRLHYSWIRHEAEDGFLIAERDGSPVGYCRATNAALSELGLRDGHHDAGLALVDAMVQRAAKLKESTLGILLPANETLITQFPRLRYKRELSEHIMLRVIDLKALLDAALETAAERLSAVGRTGTHTLALEVLGQKCAIHVEKGQASAESLPETAAATPLAQKEFLKLVFGATLEKDLAAFTPEEQRLLRDLFPPDGPVCWRADVL